VKDKQRTLALAVALSSLAGLLLLLPTVVRWFYLYDGQYRPGAIARPDLSAIEVATPEVSAFVDRTTASTTGIILVDRAHENRFEMTELNVLQSRLAARGRHLEPVIATENLSRQLRPAQALVVISPGKSWTAGEIRQVKEFVANGGRLLLVTDATRFVVLTDDLGTPLGYDNDVSHIGDLASQFGLIFQADYLYNTTDNENNFRNIRLTDFSSNDLTRGLKEVVFYAAHSIVSEQPGLIKASGETRSSNSDRTQDLAAAALAADGAVLALGDVTFLSEPYNAVADNDRLVANIADFLSGAQRQYDLGDFPLFFGETVDLVYAGDPSLDGELLPAGSALQAALDDTGRELTVRQDEDKTHDTLFLGLYEKTQEIKPYLAVAQVNVWFTPTEESGEEASLEGGFSSEPLTVSLELTETGEITLTAETATTATNRIEIESLGTMVLTDTALLVLEADGQRQVLVVLSDTEAGLRSAVQRLTDRDLSDCVLRKTETPARTTLALCPIGQKEPDGGVGGRPEDAASRLARNRQERVLAAFEPHGCLLKLVRVSVS